MKVRDYVAHSILGTSFEIFAKEFITLSQFPKRIRHPELSEIYVESVRTELVIKKLSTVP